MQPLADLLESEPTTSWPDSPVPITFVITDLDIGGAERALVNLATRLDRHRWLPSVVCLDKPSDLNSPLRDAGIEVINLEVSRRKPIRAVLSLSRALRRLRPRLVQSFLFHANLAARLAAPLAGSPPVVCGIRVAEREKTWHLALDRWTSRLAVGSICVSAGVRKFAEDAGGISPKRLTVIPNGIDTSLFNLTVGHDRRIFGIEEGARVALFVGRLVKQKDVPTLLNAAAIVARDNPTFHLMIVGDGPDHDSLVTQAEELPGLNGRVHWLGRRDDVSTLLFTCDFLVLPSLWEGMPNVVLEAMASRRAVIATQVEGSEELVVPGLTGWLVPPADAPLLAAAMAAAVREPKWCEALGIAGRRRVDSFYSMERIVEAYENVWAKVLGYQRTPCQDC